MKLYAITSSERASKGQGGNDYLNIKLYGKDQMHLATIHLYPDSFNPDEYMLHVRTPDNSLCFGQLLPIDNQKKDECIHCKGTGKVHAGFADKVDCDACNGTGVKH